MSEQGGFGWLLVIVGLVIAGAGLIWVFAPSIHWFGRLPGDIHVEGRNGSFYFPLMTCLLLSLAISALMWAIRIFRGDVSEARRSVPFKRNAMTFFRKMLTTHALSPSS